MQTRACTRISAQSTHLCHAVVEHYCAPPHPQLFSLPQAARPREYFSIRLATGYRHKRHVSHQRRLSPHLYHDSSHTTRRSQQHPRTRMLGRRVVAACMRALMSPLPSFHRVHCRRGNHASHLVSRQRCLAFAPHITCAHVHCSVAPRLHRTRGVDAGVPVCLHGCFHFAAPVLPIMPFEPHASRRAVTSRVRSSPSPPPHP